MPGSGSSSMSKVDLFAATAVTCATDCRGGQFERSARSAGTLSTKPPGSAWPTDTSVIHAGSRGSTSDGAVGAEG